MKSFNWDVEKNNWLKENRNICFEDIVVSIYVGDLLEVVKNPSTKYSNQFMFVVNIVDYIYLVPYVDSGEEIFLKTIIPSRKATKKYLGGKKNEGQTKQRRKGFIGIIQQ